jgi:hypothetical protein
VNGKRSDEPTSAELARAVCLRGIVGTFFTRIAFTQKQLVGSELQLDDFSTPWEALPLPVRQRWFQLAGVVERVAGTPGWEGALQCIEPAGET